MNTDPEALYEGSGDPLAELRCLIVEKRNSVDFVRRVLAAYQTDQVVVPVTGDPPPVLGPFIAGERVVPAPGGGWFAERAEPRFDSAPAHVSLTSGTTGEPKPILLSHRALGDVTTRLSEVMRLDDSVREYVGVPVTFSFGFARVRAVAANGGATFIPDHGFRVDELATMIAAGEVNALSAVPTLLRLVLAERERFAGAAGNLRWIEIGSQPMLASEKAVLRDLFPSARIVQHYGLTEASRSTFLVVSDASPEELESVGKPTGAVDIRITSDDRIAIKGPHLAEGIITADGLALIADPDGWLITQDLGHFVDGNLYFDGRADDLINVGGLKIQADQFETLLRQKLPEDTGIGIGAGHDALRGQLVVVAHEPASTPSRLAELDAAARATARELGIGDAFALHAMAAIPRTETGKIRRFEIADAFDRTSRSASEAPAREDGGGGARSGVQQAFIHVFGSRAADRSQSFQSLGGDSLNYVSMLTALERHIALLPDDWDRVPIERLEAHGGVETGSGNKAVEAAFAAVFGENRIEEGASFHSLGGDSLNYVQMLTSLERVIPDLPEDWASMSIAALSGQASKGGGAQPQSSTRRFIPTNLDTVRGLACVLVVALHVVGTRETSGLKLPLGSSWHYAMNILELIRMPLFTAMAGFLYAAMPAGRDGFWPFMRRKLGLLLLPLLFVTFVLWGLLHVTYGPPESLFDAYVFGYRHLWYLDVLLMIFALVSFADIKLGQKPRTWAIILVGVIIVDAVIPEIRLLHIKGMFPLFPFFIIGMLLYREPSLLRSWPLLAVSALVVGAIFSVRVFDVPLFFKAPALLTLLCGSASIIFFMRVFPRLSFFERIAPYSFTIYLWHPEANALVRNILWKIGFHSVPSLFCIGIVAGVTIPIALHLIMIRMPRYISAPVIAR